MRDPLPKGLMGRLAAAFFVFSGVTSFLRGLPLGADAGHVSQLLAVELGVVAIGVAAWFAPWERWPRRALFSLVVCALTAKTAGNLVREASPFVYAIHYVVLFMWIGVALPRWTGVAASPLLLLSYVVPLLAAGRSAGDLASIAVVVPVCVFTGEAAAWIATRLRVAEQRSQGRTLKMAALVDAASALAASRQADELAHLTAVAALELHGASRALVLLESPEGGLERAGDASWKPEDVAPVLASPCLLPLREAARRDDAPPDRDDLARLAREVGARAVEVLALKGSGEPLGLLLVAFDRDREPPDEFTASVARTLATQAGLGFERVRLAESLLDASLRDPLTGVGNRRKAMQALELLKEGDVVALIDLDHFKSVNDRYGHAAGDRVLRTLGDYLRSVVRPPDEVFRLGGEEFLIVLSGGGDQGMGALERIHERWRVQKRVTSFSAGLAVRRADEAPDATLARADSALYAAKHAGRDRVVAHRPDLDGTLEDHTEA